MQYGGRAAPPYPPCSGGLKEVRKTKETHMMMARVVDSHRKHKGTSQATKIQKRDS